MMYDKCAEYSWNPTNRCNRRIVDHVQRVTERELIVHTNLYLCIVTIYYYMDTSTNTELVYPAWYVLFRFNFLKDKKLFYVNL